MIKKEEALAIAKERNAEKRVRATASLFRKVSEMLLADLRGGKLVGKAFAIFGGMDYPLDGSKSALDSELVASLEKGEELGDYPCAIVLKKKSGNKTLLVGGFTLFSDDDIKALNEFLKDD